MYGRSMLFRQVTHDDLGCASYLVGDNGAGVAAVIDPRFEIDVYLDLARYTGVRFEHILVGGGAICVLCGDVTRRTPKGCLYFSHQSPRRAR